MIYRQLGRTGLEVSQLGFGAMRLPMVGAGQEQRVNRDLAIPMIHRAFENGLNYIDTAVGYCNQDSQRVVGEALKGWRDKIVVSTKNPYYGTDEKEWWTNLDDSLERLQVSHIDIYNHHGIRWQRYEEDVVSHLGQWMMKAKEQGLIRHICCSFHDSNEALRKLVDSGYPEVITLQYNILDRQLEDGIAHAHEKGVGIVVMGPVGGGRLGATSEVLEQLVPGIRRVPELALRFVLANPNVSVALSGMSTMQHVEENFATAADPVSLSEADKQAIQEHLERMKKMAELYCSGCEYCLPCPNDVSIPAIFAAYNVGRVYGLWGAARSRYAAIGRGGKGAKADACLECGVCEEKCPQMLRIPEQLKAAHRELAPA
ncbi:MAG: aldo/keto reductase [Armatimonadetes bacterium]|nr:aldo/keto reductase [Armatimonadota bacterium]